MKLSISSYNKYQMCKRLYWLEKVEGWSEKRTKPWLEFGSNFGELMAFIDVEGTDKALERVPEMFGNPFKAAEVEYLVRKWEIEYGDQPEPVLGLEMEEDGDFIH